MEETHITKEKNTEINAEEQKQNGFGQSNINWV